MVKIKLAEIKYFLGIFLLEKAIIFLPDDVEGSWELSIGYLMALSQYEAIKKDYY